ncbi:SDR family oxidoreductase [Runella zeae]|uniref:SDR family oxidoreductase n=1 Tax=Runella zeae TaxID=94255 RepID=UPI000426C0EE|nr:SDR family oxidoreductase [Runella zeae]
MNPLLIVTGGTKGIGRALIERFVEGGFDVVTCSRNKNDLESLRADLQYKYPNSQIFIKVSDLSQKEEVRAFASFIKALKRPVDIVVNNTGIFAPSQVHSEPEGTLEKMIETNLYSAYYLTRELIEGMKAQKKGHIFNMCSIASTTAYINGGAYAVSKFALYGMTKLLRQEMKQYGVKVTAVLPGATLTPSWEGVELPSERFIRAEDVAEMVWSTAKLSPESVIEEILIRPQLGDIV